MVLKKADLSPGIKLLLSDIFADLCMCVQRFIITLMHDCPKTVNYTWVCLGRYKGGLVKQKIIELIRNTVN